MTATVTITSLTADEYAAALPEVGQRLKMPLHFLHSELYGAWQTAAGKQVVYYGINRGEQLIGCGMAIQYALPRGLSYLYSPYGPLLQDWSNDVTDALATFFKPWAKRAMFVRFDTAGEAFKKPSHAAAATASLQPRNEWVLDLTPGADALFEQMHKKARYQIRVGERNGVVVEFQPTSPELFKEFYALLTETSDRNKFGLQAEKTYQAVFATLLDSEAFLATARLDGQLGAAALILPYAGEAHYVFGSSSSTPEFRKIGPSYLLQWECIKHAIELGCTQYNFGGISDDVKSTHLHGVTEFKKRFGGAEVTHPLPSDLVLQPLRYKAFNTYKRFS